ncbi:MAG: IPT/TIG domain-containing protein [Bacteroidota bacterium]
MKNVLRIVVGITVILLFGCKDLGTSAIPSQAPVVSVVSPSSAAVGDTIRITGSNFGPVQASSEVLLANCSTAVIIAWSDNEIRVKLPNIAANVAVRVNVGSRISNSVALAVTGFISGNVSYAADVRPVLLYGCTLSGCHIGPSPVSGFDQSTYAGLRAGGINYGSNVVVPGDSTNSGIIREMRGTGIVGRMPFGGPWQASGVPDSLIRRTALWIQQGALYN